jgi:hypothetical protein
MTISAARQPKGVPVGGQFAATIHTEPSVSLGAPTVAPEYVGNRLEQLHLAGHLDAAQIAVVTSRLNASKDFSDRNIADTADEIHLLEYGNTATDARAAKEGLRALQSLGHADQADAIERVRASQASGDRGQTSQAKETAPAPVPDGISAPVPANDARVQAGQVFDQVEVDGVTFHRRREGVFPGWPDSMRLQASRPLTDEEKRRFAGLVGYAYRASVAGEPLGEPDSDSPYSFVVSADLTKSRRDDVGIALEQFEESLAEYIQEGSPVRTTNRSGPGTMGTRLVEGFNEPDLTFELYYDAI